MYVFRVDHLERDNLCGGNPFSLSQQPLASCSPSSMGGIMWNFTCLHRHVNWYYHYWHWSCSGKLNVETDRCLFPMMSRRHNLSTGVLGIWFLQSFPLLWFFLSLGFKGCISDLLPQSFILCILITCASLLWSPFVAPQKGASLMRGESPLICAYKCRYSENSYDVALVNWQK